MINSIYQNGSDYLGTHNFDKKMLNRTSVVELIIPSVNFKVLFFYTYMYLVRLPSTFTVDRFTMVLLYFSIFPP